MKDFFIGLGRCILVCAISLSGINPSFALTQSPTSTAVASNTKDMLGKLPLAFEENQGQADPAVKYLSRGSGYKLFLTAQEAVMVFSKTSHDRPALDAHIQGDVDTAPQAYQAAVVRMRFDRSNRTPVVKGIDPLDFKTNYFVGASPAQQFTGIANHSKVKFASIYPGVDLIYYGNQQQLEYDLLVAPHAKTSQIKISFAGADKITLAKNGDLVLSTAVGDIVYQKPIAYQELDGQRQTVAAEYRLAGKGKVAFRLGKYDASKPLVIDPILSYSSYFWGLKAAGIAVDAAGNAYVTGTISTFDLPASTGYQTKLAGNVDAYVAKVNPSGTGLVYATYLGVRRANTSSVGVSVDGAGSAYITGTTSSASFPVTAGAYQTAYTTGASFVTKLNAAGNGLAYSTFLNGASTVAIKVDGAGNAYLTGNANSIATTTGVFQPTRLFSSSPFIAKLNSAGTAMAYVTYLGGSAADVAKSIAVDTSGNAYVTGAALSNDFPIKNAFQPSLLGARDAFVTKLNPTATALIYSTYLGGTGDDAGNGIDVDAAGQAHVVGYAYSNNFPVTENAFQKFKGYPDEAVSNAFISKLSSTGTELLYSSYLGGRWCLTASVNSCFGLFSDGIDVATSVAVDAAGYAYMAGFATSIGFPQTDLIQRIGAAGGDEWRTPFVAKISPDGSRRVYSIILGERSPNEQANGIAVDNNGNAYVAGYSSDAAFPLTGAPLKSTRQNFNNFIFKLSTGKYPTTVVSSSSQVFGPQPITFTAYVLSATPGGTVTFMNGASVLGQSGMADGTASFTTILPAGIHKITAVYSADGKASPPIYQIVQAGQ